MEKKVFTRSDFDCIIKDVVFWNSLAGNFPEDKTLEEVYLQLSREEMFGKNEFLQGWFTGDRVMQADGVGDLLFTVGMLSSILGETDAPSSYEDYLGHLLTEEVVEMLSSVLISYQGAVRDYLFGLCLKMSEVMDVYSVFRVIYESNVSKFIHESEIENGIDLDAEARSIESQGRYAEVSYKQVGEYFAFTAGRDVESGVVFSKPKIVKASTFKEPASLEKFIY